MVYFCKRDSSGNIVGVGQAPDAESIPVGHEVCTAEERDAWLETKAAEQEALEQAQAARPSSEAQLRADLDYLAAYQGVSLDPSEASDDDDHMGLLDDVESDAYKLAKKYYPSLWGKGQIRALVKAGRMEEDEAAKLLGTE